MDKRIAQKIGSTLAIKFGLAGLILAYFFSSFLIMGSEANVMQKLCWIKEANFKCNLFVGAMGVLVVAYFLGQLAGIAILINKRNHWGMGLVCSVLALLAGIFLGSTVGFIQEGAKYIGTNYGNPIFDYYAKPFYWLLLFGIIPAIFLGLFFGKQIKKQEKNIL